MLQSVVWCPIKTYKHSCSAWRKQSEAVWGHDLGQFRLCGCSRRRLVAPSGFGAGLAFGGSDRLGLMYTTVHYPAFGEDQREGKKIGPQLRPCCSFRGSNDSDIRCSLEVCSWEAVDSSGAHSHLDCWSLTGFIAEWQTNQIISNYIITSQFVQRILWQFTSAWAWPDTWQEILLELPTCHSIKYTNWWYDNISIYICILIYHHLYVAYYGFWILCFLSVDCLKNLPLP